LADSAESPVTDGTVSITPTDWNNVSPNQVMARFKLLKAKVYEHYSLY